MAQPLPNGGDPATENFPKGPDIGEPIPKFTLPNQWGDPVSYHPDGTRKALVLFHRSADW